MKMSLASFEYRKSESPPERLEIYLTRDMAREIAEDLLSLSEAASDNRVLGYFSAEWGVEHLRDTPLHENHSVLHGVTISLVEGLA